MLVFSFLGELSVRMAGQPLPVGPARQRIVLAALAFDANKVVPVDQLVDRVWGEEPPQRARSVLGTYISRLRHVLGGKAVAWRSGGYILMSDRSAVDVHRFHDLCGRARTTSDDAQVATLFTEALQLWHGSALTGVDNEWASAQRDRLNQQRLAAEHDLIDVRLRGGHGESLVAELNARCDEHPLDERVAGQYMLALHRAGRTADALDHYQRTRCRLAEELGGDPGPRLQELHLQILNADHVLIASARPPRPRGTPVPRQLPPVSAGFIGRVGNLGALDALAAARLKPDSPTMLCTIAGAGGMGKTWLALQWAHRNVDRFPDGQLFVDLRGFDPSDHPMSAEAALRGFLQALGVEHAALPTGLDAQVGLYRSLLAERRVLVIADNAADTAQILPLVPGGSSCAMLVTSRIQLTGLVCSYGAHPVTIDVLSHGEARSLFTDRVGRDRIAAEPAAVTEILDYCAGLPLALSILAGRLLASSCLSLARLAQELRGAGVSMLDDGDRLASLAEVFDCSYRALALDQARALCLLAVAPGPDIGLQAAASLLGLSVAQTGTTLNGLTRASLVDQDAAGRYRMHDLVRELATARAVRCLAADDRDDALRRHAEFYLHTAFAGDRRLSPNRHPIGLAPPVPGVVPLELSDDTSVLAWFDAEHSCLLAVQRAAVVSGRDDVVWQLAWSVNRFHYRRSCLAEDITVTELALGAAERLGDTETVVEMRRLLGLALARQGQREVALDHLRQTLGLAEGRVEPQELAYVHQAITIVLGWSGQDRQAYRHASAALRIYQDLQTPHWEADALNSVGWHAAKLGDLDLAWQYCQKALVLQRLLHDEGSEAIALDSLGYIDHRLGRHAEAVGHYRQSVALLRTVGDVYQLAATLEALGHPYRALNRLADARAVWTEAIELYQTQQRMEDAERLRRSLCSP